jgi:CMP-N-acetylneuraminic acid synthetase
MFSRIYVSTEDLEIKQVAGEAGAIVIDRPVELAGDEVSTEDVVDHAFEYFKNEGEYPVYFSVLQATSPLRTGKHIEECIKGFVHEVYCNSAVSVYLNNGELRYNGAIYVTRTNSYLNLKPGKRELVIDPVFFYHMSIKESVDIDTPEDFAKAGEYLTKRG